MYRSYDTNTIYKDNVNKVVTGVCAGVARRYQLANWQVRAAAVGCLIMFPMPTGVAYVVATLLLRSR